MFRRRRTRLGMFNNMQDASAVEGKRKTQFSHSTNTDEGDSRREAHRMRGITVTLQYARSRIEKL